ncbi:MAG: thioredoxin fold domain-containing protein [Acidobacteriota bacterium]
MNKKRNRLFPATILLSIFSIAFASGIYEACLAMANEARASNEILWLEDFGKTLDAAKKDNRLMMVAFYTSWCVFCKKLDREVFTDPRVVELSKEIVCAKLDAEIQRVAATRYRPAGFPTIIFAIPDGTEVFRISGYRTPDEFYSVMKIFKEKGFEISQWHDIIKKNPKETFALKSLGRIYLDLGLSGEAVQYLNNAKKSLTEVAKDATKKATPTGSSDEMATNEAPLNIEAERNSISFFLGRAYLGAGEHKKALKIFQGLIDDNPESLELPDYYLELGRVYLFWGKKDKAKEIFASLTKQYPDSIAAKKVAGLFNHP